jgi:hypothetical protein
MRTGMSYTLYTDKPTVFECRMELSGASLKQTQARLVIEGVDRTLMFVGTVSSEGVCSIPVNKLRGLLDEHSTGKMKLEVIAEDTYFQPWESEYIVENSKQLTVEVKQVAEIKKPAIQVNVATQKIDATSKLVTEIAGQLRKKGITQTNAVKYKQFIRTTITEQANHNNYAGDVKSLIAKVVHRL